MRQQLGTQSHVQGRGSTRRLRVPPSSNRSLSHAQHSQRNYSDFHLAAALAGCGGARRYLQPLVLASPSADHHTPCAAQAPSAPPHWLPLHLLVVRWWSWPLAASPWRAPWAAPGGGQGNGMRRNLANSMPAIWAHIVCRSQQQLVTSCINLVTAACMNTRTMHCMCVLQEAPSYLRLPHPHADQERSQGAQGPPRQGPPQPVPCQREVLRRQEEVNAQHDTARQRHQQLTGLWPTSC